MSRALHLNETVYVKLTKEGKGIWSRTNPGRQAPVFIECQLWQLMECFGPHMRVGAQPFDGEVKSVEPVEPVAPVSVESDQNHVEVLVWRWRGNPQTAEYGTPEIYRVRADGKERHVHSGKIARYLKALNLARSANGELEGERWDEGTRVP